MKGFKWLAIFIIGLGLWIEHAVVYGYYDFELLGHETYGLIMMGVGGLMFTYRNLKDRKFKWNSKEDHT